MKILLLFCDMLRANLLNSIDSTKNRKELDEILSNMGGTLYTNCYSPAPDTPRAFGTIWSGKYPNDNGCNTRLKYPNYWLKKPEESFLSILHDYGYQLNLYVSNATKNVGVLPGEYEVNTTSNTEIQLDQYMQELKLDDNSLTFLDMEDFHHAINDIGANEQGALLGYDLVGKIFNTIEKTINFDAFDLTIALSDHGFKYTKDSKNMNGYQLLNADRTKVFMFIRKKGVKELQFDSRICSLIDVFDTVLDCAGIENTYALESYSLNKDKKHEFVMIEDHKNFNAELGQTIEYWGIVNKDGLAVTGCNKVWNASYKMSENTINEFEHYLRKYGSFYSENIKMAMILNLYQESVKTTKYYFDGSYRKKKTNYRSEVKKIIKKVLHYK